MNIYVQHLSWECLYNVDDVMVETKVSVRLSLTSFLRKDGRRTILLSTTHRIITTEVFLREIQNGEFVFPFL